MDPWCDWMVTVSIILTARLKTFGFLMLSFHSFLYVKCGKTYIDRHVWPSFRICYTANLNNVDSFISNVYAIWSYCNNKIHNNCFRVLFLYFLFWSMIRVSKVRNNITYRISSKSLNLINRVDFLDIYKNWIYFSATIISNASPHIKQTHHLSKLP